MSMAAKEVIAWFADIGLQDRLQVGGKGGSLGELQRAGIAVPPGFVITTSAFERFIDALERKAALRARVQSLDGRDLAAVAACCNELRARVEAEPFPVELQEEISAAYLSLCGAARGTPV